MYFCFGSLLKVYPCLVVSVVVCLIGKVCVQRYRAHYVATSETRGNAGSVAYQLVVMATRQLLGSQFANARESKGKGCALIRMYTRVCPINSISRRKCMSAQIIHFTGQFRCAVEGLLCPPSSQKSAIQSEYQDVSARNHNQTR